MTTDKVIGCIVNAYFGGLELELTVAGYQQKEDPNMIRLVDAHGVLYTFRKQPKEKKFPCLRFTERRLELDELNKRIATRHAMCRMEHPVLLENGGEFYVGAQT